METATATDEIIASHPYRIDPSMGVVVGKYARGGKFFMGRYSTFSGIGLRYIVISRHDSEADARKAANREWASS